MVVSGDLAVILLIQRGYSRDTARLHRGYTGGTPGVHRGYTGGTPTVQQDSGVQPHLGDETEMTAT